MKRIVTTLFLVVLTVCLLVPAASAETYRTLEYSVSSTRLDLTAEHTGRFTITVPNASGTPYDGIQFQIKMPAGGVINAVSYSERTVSIQEPKIPPGGQMPDTYLFSCRLADSADEGQLAADLICTIDITYNGSTEQVLIIEEIIKSIVVPVSGERFETDDYVSNRTTDITLVPYRSGSGDPEKSNDASLLALSINSGAISLSPPFNSNTRTYTASVANSVTSINLYATATHSNATVKIDGPSSLIVGSNTFTITVTAEDGETTRNYTLTVTRQSPPGSPGDGGGPETKTDDPNSTQTTDDPAEVPEETPETPIGSLGDTITLTLDRSGAKGYISGYPDNTVRVGNNITRYEAAVIFYNLITQANKASYVNEAARFSDVATGQWYTEAVGYLVAAEVLSGYPDGTFKGDNPITRAEFTTIAMKFGESNLTGEIPFSDVASSHWAYSFIQSAYNNSFIAGYPDGTFGPDRNITRAEAFVIMNKLLGWDASAVTGGAADFTDLVGGEWYYNDVLLAVNGRS